MTFNVLEDIPFEILAAGSRDRRVLVCGGRDFALRNAMFAFLDSQHAVIPFTLLIHGACSRRGDPDGVYCGADGLADEWARSRDVSVNAYPADWVRFDKAAGPIRNKQMLVEGCPHVVNAFPGGFGTANMVKQAVDAGVPVITWPVR